MEVWLNSHTEGPAENCSAPECCHRHNLAALAQRHHPEGSCSTTAKPACSRRSHGHHRIRQIASAPCVEEHTVTASTPHEKQRNWQLVGHTDQSSSRWGQTAQSGHMHGLACRPSCRVLCEQAAVHAAPPAGCCVSKLLWLRPSCGVLHHQAAVAAGLCSTPHSQ